MRHLIPLFLAALAFVAPPARAEEPEPARESVKVEMQCDRAGEPGRVRCTVEARAREGTIRWGDVVIRSSPGFAMPLKGRIGPTDASLREPANWRWGLALVARSTGRGDLAADVRLVICDASGRCEAKVVESHAKVAVGT